MATAIDLHQHLWPEAVLQVLEERRSAPRALWRGDGRWQIRLEAEPAFEIDPRDHDPQDREASLSAQGVDRALLALSSPVAAESLLAAVVAWNEFGESLPGGLGWWAAVPSSSLADRVELAREALGRGAAGVCLPASELASPRLAQATVELLDLLEREGAPLFVHPGPVRAGSPGAPAWWSSSTDYVAQQQAAWHTFAAIVRPEFPRLRVIFALLAGLAPLQAERSSARGAPIGERGLHDPLCFYDTSSYGPRAVRALATVIGIGQLVHGTDHPVQPAGPEPVAGAFGPGFSSVVRRDNPSRALGYEWVPA